MFDCFAENALENPFLSCFSHFLRSKQILLHIINIYKQHKKQKSKQKHHLFTNLVRWGRKIEIEGKRDRERENRSRWRRRRSDRVGLGWSMAARSVIGGGGQCDGEPGGARPAVGCQDRSLSVHGWRSERWIGDEGGVG